MSDTQGAAKAAPSGIVAWIRNIDIRWVASVLGILTAVEALVAHGDVTLAGLAPSTSDIVKTWCGNFVVINQVLLVGHAGTAVSWTMPRPAVKAIIAFFVVAMALSLALPAMAQPRLKLPIPLPQPKPAAALAAPADPLGDFMTQLEAVKADVINNVIADIQAADADAGAIITPAIPANPTATPPTPAIAAVVRDPIAHACYPAAIQFLQSTPQFQPPTGKLIGVQLFQRKRDFIAQLQAGLPTYLKLGCAPLLGDEVNTFIQIMAMVGVKIAPLGIAAICPPCAAAAAPIALPALTLTP